MTISEAKGRLYNFHRFGNYISPGDYDKAIEMLGKKEAKKIERKALYERNNLRWKKEKANVR